MKTTNGAPSRLRAGARLAARELTTISGAGLVIPDPDHLIHLQFRRFAGCPVCDLHLRTLVRRREELRAAGLREVVVFHSRREELLAYTGELPFDIVADPDKRLYAEFGIESAPRALLDPRAWVPIVTAVARSLRGVMREGRKVPPVYPEGGRFGLPGEFLIARDGRIVAVKYGEHVYDQWSVDELLGLARDIH
jgi:peroxiredoxin